MKLHPSTYAILHFTPWARLRGPQDRFWPLFWSAVVLLMVIVYFLLRVEAEYRHDARSRITPPLSVEGSRTHPDAQYGATVLSVRDGQPLLNW